jgi:diaminohydroxyphosphoribosylaminopyrimidine deaminase/5-amino-6-(5-phosphoribosylamino)uracil reductase
MPNPSVGAVVVVGGQIVAEGVTSAYGGAHAEVNAINAVKDLSVLERATLYVSLEPCSHFGKTPPCADLVIKHKIPRVVVGCLDPNPKVAGAGVQRMEASGIEVVINILEKECRESNKRFFCFH